MESSAFYETLDTIAWILRPIGIAFYYVALLVLSILQLLSGPILAALQPFLYLLYAVYWFLSLPIRLLAKLEPLYDYIGAAIILGGLLGLALNYSFNQFDQHLNLDFLLAYLPNQGRPAQQYKPEKVKEIESDPPPMSPFEYASLSDSVASTSRSQRSKNLLDQTIMEEDDSDF